MSEPMEYSEIIMSNDILTCYERREIDAIYRFKEIYYLGTNANKIQVCHDNLDEYNNSKGYYKVIKHDHIHYRYEIKRKIGVGTFSDVVLAYDHKEQRNVAIKIIRKNNRSECSGETQMLATLKRYNDATHTVKMYESFNFRGHNCIVFELMFTNLWRLITSKKNGLPLSTVKTIATSLLQGLDDLRKVNIVHMDLKPNNILLVSANEYNVKISDFGSSMYEKPNYTAYFQISPYRAPEIMLELPFGCPVDMWSFACIIAHLYTGRRLFTGRSDEVQLAYFRDAIGAPPQSLLEQSSVAHRYFDPSGFPIYYKKLQEKPPAQQDVGTSCWNSDPPNLHLILNNKESEEFADFVRKCLTWEQDKRLTPEQGLAHPWITGESSKDNESSK